MWRVQQTAAQVVQQVLLQGRNLDRALEAAQSSAHDWAPAQRAALQDLSFGTLRFHGRLTALLAELAHKPLTDPQLLHLLQVALYQLFYGKSAPYAVVDNAVQAARNLNPRVAGMTNAILRNALREREALWAKTDAAEMARFNHPEWWIAELRKQYGDRAEAILTAGNQHPPMTLRVNQRATTTAAYLARLTEQNIAAKQIGPTALLLEKPVGVDKLPEFFAGDVSVQDAGAQLAAPLLDVHDDMRVLDACAAPGGKTAHILEIARVKMLALDKDEQRLRRVSENLQRLKLTAELKVGDAARPQDWWDGQPFERILADVPCSASGVVRRHPDIKWLRRPQDVGGFAAQQAGILSALWQLLAQDGKLLYATCSVFGQENERVIANFLEARPDAQRLPLVLPDHSQGQLLPNEQHDGFFYALLHKAA
jgi:16S rRNA (cytosine967-C5)-methyltransferase